MILSSHIIIAYAAASPLAAKPLTALSAAGIFFIALASHYVMDMIPHWQYRVPSIDKEKEKFVSDKKMIARDIIKVALDGLIGLIVAFLIVGLPINLNKIFVVALITFASVFPDFLSAMYFIFKNKLLKKIYQFHFWIHTPSKLDSQPIKGISLNIVVIILIVVLFRVVF